MSDSVQCAICGRHLPTHESYLVRIEVLADPSMPPLSTDDLKEIDFDQTWADLLEQMEHLSAEEAQDQVYRRFEYRLCRSCQLRFLVNPLGLPRHRQPRGN